MAADKHFHPPGPLPEGLRDREPDDMPAARWIILIVVGMVVAGAIVATVFSKRVQEAPAPIEQMR
ncbi:MAG: hypothetical protein H6595_08485 [Flavobacteriales bacterium]|nr:hypothetical protein [Flavobacteriales bacterium]MCB9167503.1 hypothetical protein [Flavobacteriales bacterium]